ncbi:ABC transporter related protein, partial [Candidatus Arthromitus sp. SFB-5]
MNRIVEFKNVSKQYKVGEVIINALHDVNFSIDRGEFVVILGASGAGKTTILNILGGMDSASVGDIVVDGESITNFSKNQLTKYRREKIGFVFQFYNLIPNLTAIENVEFATSVCKNFLDAKDMLTKVGLSERIN